ncbi:MAG: hypothetical protein ACFCVE_02040 [Phycisphaerae bacterium]
MTTRATTIGRRAGFAPGFNFIEVMFAIGVLALGFIMIAGIFPVAIQQTQETRQMAAANSVIDSAENLIRAQFAAADAQSLAFPTGTTVRTLDGLYTSGGVSAQIVGPLFHGRVMSGMPNYAWTAFFLRPAAGAPVSVRIVATVCRNADRYTDASLNAIAPDEGVLTPVTIAGVEMLAPVIPGDPVKLGFMADPGLRVVSGTTVIILNGAAAGEAFKLGSRFDDPTDYPIFDTTFELLPVRPVRGGGQPPASSAAFGTPFDIVLIGAMPDKPDLPAGPGNLYRGGPQDVLVSDLISIDYTN